MTDLIKLSALAATAWLICLAFVYLAAKFDLRRQDMKLPPGVDGSVFVHDGRWTFDIVVNKAPHLRRQGTRRNWTRRDAERAAKIWAGKLLEQCRPRRVDCDYESETK